MPIEKLEEFAKDGQRNTDDLSLTDGFPVIKKPARQWFNWLFYELTKKINEIIDANYLQSTDIIDNLTTAESQKALSANMGKKLQDDKLGKTENAVSASKLETARTISFSGAATGSASFDGSSNASAILTLANSGVAASTYGANNKIPVITVNAKGLITGVSEKTIPEVVDASTEQKGISKLNNTLTSTSVAEALTANMGRVLAGRDFGIGYDFFEEKQNRLVNTNYINTDAGIRFLILSSTSSIQFYIDDVMVFENTGAGSFTFPISPGKKYRVNGQPSGNTPLFRSFSEYKKA